MEKKGVKKREEEQTTTRGVLFLKFCESLVNRHWWSCMWYLHLADFFLDHVMVVSGPLLWSESDVLLHLSDACLDVSRVSLAF